MHIKVIFHVKSSVQILEWIKFWSEFYIVYVVTAVFTNNNTSTGILPTNSQVNQVWEVGMLIKLLS